MRKEIILKFQCFFSSFFVVVNSFLIRRKLSSIFFFTKSKFFTPRYIEATCLSRTSLPSLLPPRVINAYNAWFKILTGAREIISSITGWNRYISRSVTRLTFCTAG